MESSSEEISKIGEDYGREFVASLLFDPPCINRYTMTIKLAAVA